jgi:hypothetical protein
VADQPTCGQGLAEHAAVPLALAKLIDALAENLERHMPALDLADDAARQEHDAYASLAAQHRQIAAQLREVGEEMAGYRDLPMGRHDEAQLASPELLDAFVRFVDVERDILALLEDGLKRDEATLRQARG